MYYMQQNILYKCSDYYKTTYEISAQKFYGNIYEYIAYTDLLIFSMVKIIDLHTFSLVNDWYKHYKWYESCYGNRLSQDYTVHYTCNICNRKVT